MESDGRLSRLRVWGLDDNETANFQTRLLPNTPGPAVVQHVLEAALDPLAPLAVETSGTWTPGSESTARSHWGSPGTWEAR